MCFIRPLKVKEIEGKIVVLENGIKAYCDEKVGNIKANDEVLVFGNLIIEKVGSKKKEDDR